MPGGRGQGTGTHNTPRRRGLPVAKRRGARQATARCDGVRPGSDPVRSPRRPQEEISSEYHEGVLYVGTHTAAPDWRRYVPLQAPAHCAAAGVASLERHALRCVGLRMPPRRRGRGAIVASHGPAAGAPAHAALPPLRAERGVGPWRARGAALAAGAGTSGDAPFFLSFFFLRLNRGFPCRFVHRVRQCV